MKKLKEIWNKIFGKKKSTNQPNQGGSQTDHNSVRSDSNESQVEIQTKRQLGQGRYNVEGFNINNQPEIQQKRQLGQGRYESVQANNRESIDIDALINQPSSRKSTASLPSVLAESKKTKKPKKVKKTKKV